MVADLSEIDAQRDVPRIIFFGMECRFSWIVLAALLRSNVEISAIILPALRNEVELKSRPASALPALFQLPEPHRVENLLPIAPLTQVEAMSSLAHLAHRQHIPVWYMREADTAETLAVLGEYQPDLICVACFPKVLPQQLLSLPRLGCVNVHPSLLPALRGPQPTFWVLHDGLAVTGTTVHMMTPQLDGGAIVAQESFAVPDGISESCLEECCAHIGGKLLVQIIPALMHGYLQPTPQDESQCSYHSFATLDDYCVSVDTWVAHRLYNFICGVADEAHPVMLCCPEEEDSRIMAYDAVAYGDENWRLSDGTNLCGMVRNGERNEWVVACQHGWVRVRIL